MKKYIDINGLSYFWQKLKTAFAEKIHTHNYAGAAVPGGTALKALCLSSTTLTNEDLNNIINIGNYWAAGSNLVVNKPNDTNAFGLEVLQTASGYLVQRLTTHTNIVHIRTCSNKVNKTWGSWVQLAAINDVLPLSGGGTITGADYNIITLKRLGTYGAGIGYSNNNGVLGQAGFLNNGTFHILNSDGANMMSVTSSGILKTAQSGSLVYSGGISSSQGGITISNLNNYGVLLFVFSQISALGGSSNASGIVPIAYVVAGNSYDIPTSHISTPGGTDRLGKVTVSYNSSDATLTLAGNNVNSLGAVNVYSIM